MSGDPDAFDRIETVRSALRRAADVRLVGVALLGACLHVGLAKLAHDEIVGEHASAQGNLASTAAATFISWVVTAITGATLSASIVAAELGTKIGLGAAGRRAFVRFTPTLLAQIAVYFLVIFGFIALVVPGVYAAVVTSVLIPVVVNEEVGPFAAIERCRALTEGRAGRVAVLLAALWALTCVVLVIAIVAFEALVGPTDGVPFLGVLRAAGRYDVPNVIAATLVVRTVLTLAWTSVASVLYVRLRARERGSDAERIAEVFS